MQAQQITQYDALTGYLEEPIREIVPALWRLPFVEDTGHTCSGHILRGKSWYPHEATLEFAFSVDPEMAEIRDQFRAPVVNLLIQI